MTYGCILTIVLILSACSAEPTPHAGEANISDDAAVTDVDISSRDDVSRHSPSDATRSNSANSDTSAIDVSNFDINGDDPPILDVGGAPSDSGSDDISPLGPEPWEVVRVLIDSKVALSDATVLIGNEFGTVFSYSRGTSTETTSYAIASASKLIMALTMMRVIESGDLNLGSTAASILPYWSEDEADPRTQVTLEHLLSFTSGFSGGSGLIPTDPALPCIEDSQASTTDCAEMIYEDAFEFPPSGSAFFYGPTHMYIAAAMAMTVRNAPTWNSIFRKEIANDLGLPLSSGFLAPSPKNGRPSGGALMSAKDYASIFTALLSGALLSPASMKLLTTDHTPTSSVIMKNVPDVATQNGTWHYALGCWRECSAIDYDGTGCDSPGVISSPGAFGFYPWWDQANGHWGVIALQLSTPSAAAIIVPIGEQIRQLATPIVQNL